MRERQALVAYEQANSIYDVHRSDRLGCDLHEAWRITEVTPFGYSRRTEESPLIEPEPLEEDLRLQEIVDRLDYAAFSVVVVVSETFEVTPYRALWFGFEDSCVSVSESDRIGNGAVVSRPAVHGGPAVDAAFCARYGAVKRTLSGLVDDRQLSLGAARRHLRTHVGLLEEDGHHVVYASGMGPGDSSLNPQSADTSIVGRFLSWENIKITVTRTVSTEAILIRFFATDRMYVLLSRAAYIIEMITSGFTN